MAKFDKTYCSQCGAEFGPGDSGYSHCDQHKDSAEFGLKPLRYNYSIPTLRYLDRIRGIPEDSAAE